MIELQKKLKAKQYSSLYLLYGNEDYLINETVNLLIKNILKDEERDFNLSTYDLEEIPIEIPLEDAQTLPFFGDKRVVIMKNANFLTGVKDKTKVEHRIELLEQYVASPAPSAIVVIIVNTNRLDERKKITKLLKKEADAYELSLKDEKSLMQWIKNQLLPFEVNITDDAAYTLIHYARNSITLLFQEINKMAMYVGRGGTIETETVHLLSSKTIEDNIFELIDSVVHRNAPKALLIFQDLLKLNEEPIKILSLLTSQFRTIYQVKDFSQRGYGQNQIASHLKINPYRVKLALQKAPLFTFEFLSQVINELANMDHSIKSGKVDKQLAIELFILKFS